MKTIIIEDDIHKIEVLKSYLSKYCSSKINIVGSAESVAEGVDKIKTFSPDLIFLDIFLSEGNGFELLSEVSELKSNFKVIFVTAYEHYAIKAFRLNAVDYLLKPIQINELIDSVDKAYMDIQSDSLMTDHKLEQLLTNIDIGASLDFIAVSSQKKINLMKIEDIVYLESEGSYTSFILNKKPTVVSTKNLGQYEAVLEKKGFFRTHHSYLINLYHVTSIDKETGVYAKMSNGKNLPISKRKMKDLNKLLKLSI